LGLFPLGVIAAACAPNLLPEGLRRRGRRLAGALLAAGLASNAVALTRYWRAHAAGESVTPRSPDFTAAARWLQTQSPRPVVLVNGDTMEFAPSIVDYLTGFRAGTAVEWDIHRDLTPP